MIVLLLKRPGKKRVQRVLMTPIFWRNLTAPPDPPRPSYEPDAIPRVFGTPRVQSHSQAHSNPEYNPIAETRTPNLSNSTARSDQCIPSHPPCPEDILEADKAMEAAEMTNALDRRALPIIGGRIRPDGLAVGRFRGDEVRQHEPPHLDVVGRGGDGAGGEDVNGRDKSKNSTRRGVGLLGAGAGGEVPSVCIFAHALFFLPKNCPTPPMTGCAFMLEGGRVGSRWVEVILSQFSMDKD